MTTHLRTTPALLFAMATAIGFAAPYTDQALAGTTTPTVADQRQASELAFQQRRAAAQLRDAAAHAAQEAFLNARLLGPDHEQTKRSLALAQELWAAADEADQQARAYRAQVPHGQIY